MLCSIRVFVLITAFLIINVAIGPAQSTDFPAPAPTTNGIAWGGGGIWGSVPDQNAVFFRTQAAGSTWEKRIETIQGPGPIAVDDTEGLWVVDYQNKRIVRFDISTENPSEVRSIDIPHGSIRERPSITGLAWDGEMLWLATSCGMCSTFFRIDPAGEGKVVQSFFPACNPRGLSYSPIGKSLWTIAYSGPYKETLLTSREVSSNPAVVMQSQEFSDFGHGDPPEDPTVIAHFNGGMWVLDKSTGIIEQIDPSSTDP